MGKAENYPSKQQSTYTGSASTTECDGTESQEQKHSQIHIKATVRYHLRPTQITSVQMQKVRDLPRMFRNKNTQVLLAEVQNCTTMEWSFLTPHRINIQFRNCILNISVEVKIYVHIQTYTQVFLDTVFVVSIGLKQHICLSKDELLGNCGLYTMDYYFTMKRDEVVIFTIIGYI